MAEQSNRTDPAPQEQETEKEKETEKAGQAGEPWWMDHVRQNFVAVSTKAAGGQVTPPSWAIPTMTPTGQPTQQSPAQTASEAPATPEQPAEEQPAEEQPTQDLPEPTLRGVTRKIPIANILEFLSLNRQSGTLYLTNSQETFTLEILEGDVVHASSDLSTQEQLLGSILVARDKIGTEQLEDFYKRFTPNASADDLSDHESDHEELVSREDLKLALEAQAQELFNRLYAADDCSFHFYEGETSGVEQRIRMNVTRLLLESARVQDELERQDPLEEAEAVEAAAVEEEVVDEEVVDEEVGAETQEAEQAEEAAHRLESELGILDQTDTGEYDSSSELESYDEAGEFDDTMPFDGAEEHQATVSCEDIQPLDDTPPFDDSTSFDNTALLDDTPPFDPEELGEHSEFQEYEGSVEIGDEFDELTEDEDDESETEGDVDDHVDDDADMAEELDPADQRDAVP